MIITHKRKDGTIAARRITDQKEIQQAIKAMNKLKAKEFLLKGGKK